MIVTIIFTAYLTKFYIDISVFPSIAGIDEIEPFPLAGLQPLFVLSYVANKTWEYYNEHLNTQPYYYWPGYFAWNIHYEVRGYINLYRLTGDRLWLDRAVARVDHMVNLSDVNGDGVPCWGNYNSTYGSPEGPYDPPGMDGSVVIDGVISIAVMETAAAINGLYGNEPAREYREKAERYVEVISKVVKRWWNYWTSLSSDEGYYWYSPKPEAAEYGIINQFGAMCVAELILHDITGDDEYLIHPRMCANYFKRALRYLPNRDAYLWRYAYVGAEKNPDRIEDVGHGAMDVSFAFEMYRRGLVFNKTDMVRFSNTYTNIFWKETPTGISLGSHIDGSGTNDFPPILWVQLSRFNYRLWFNQWRLINKYLAARRLEKTYGGYVLQFLTEIMLYNPERVENFKRVMEQEIERARNVVAGVPLPFQPYRYMAEEEVRKAQESINKSILTSFIHVEKSLRISSAASLLGTVTYLLVGAWAVACTLTLRKRSVKGWRTSAETLS